MRMKKKSKTSGKRGILGLLMSGLSYCSLILSPLLPSPKALIFTLHARELNTQNLLLTIIQAAYFYKPRVQCKCSHCLGKEHRLGL